MRKLILCGSALLFSLGFVKAQGWTTTGAHDDFAQTAFYKNGPNKEGVVWYSGDPSLVLDRPGTGVMTVTATNAGGAGNYPLFGINFNDTGDNGTGTPFLVNLSGGQADITIVVENTSSTDDIFMDIKLVDMNDVQSDYEPNVADVKDTSTYGYAGAPTFHYRRKALNGFTLAAGDTKTIVIDLSSVPANLGGLTGGSYTNCATGPFYCPTTSHAIDPSKIKAVLFRVNFGNGDINLSEGDGDPTLDTYIKGTTIQAFTGVIKVHDFKIGTAVPTITATQDAQVGGSLSVYPNPADEVLTVSFDATSSADVSLSDMLGNKVLSTFASAGSNQITMNTSSLPSGLYILNVATANGMATRKVTIK